MIDQQPKTLLKNLCKLRTNNVEEKERKDYIKKTYKTKRKANKYKNVKNNLNCLSFVRTTKTQHEWSSVEQSYINSSGAKKSFQTSLRRARDSVSELAPPPLSLGTGKRWQL